MTKLTGNTPRIAPGLRVGLIALTAVALVGCAETVPWGGTAKPKTSEQAVVPEPAPAAAKTAATAPKARPGPTMTRKAPPIPASRDLALSVTYLVRILVPVGSELTVRADGATDAPSIKTIKTASGPPYAVEIPVRGDKAAYPMTVDATLQSLVGHTLKGSVTLDEPPGDAPVEIVLDPVAE